MRRNVDRSILTIALGLLLVAPIAAQRLRLEFGPENNSGAWKR